MIRTALACHFLLQEWSSYCNACGLTLTWVNMGSLGRVNAGHRQCSGYFIPEEENQLALRQMWVVLVLIYEAALLLLILWGQAQQNVTWWTAPPWWCTESMRVWLWLERSFWTTMFPICNRSFNLSNFKSFNRSFQPLLLLLPLISFRNWETVDNVSTVTTPWPLLSHNPWYSPVSPPLPIITASPDRQAYSWIITMNHFKIFQWATAKNGRKRQTRG